MVHSADLSSLRRGGESKRDELGQPLGQFRRDVFVSWVVLRAFIFGRRSVSSRACGVGERTVVLWCFHSATPIKVGLVPIIIKACPVNVQIQNI